MALIETEKFSAILRRLKMDALHTMGDCKERWKGMKQTDHSKGQEKYEVFSQESFHFIRGKLILLGTKEVIRGLEV